VTAGPLPVAAAGHGIVRTVTTPVGPVRIRRRLAGLVVPAVLLTAACTAAPPPASGLPPIGAPVAPPPAPPAACLLDTDALGTATGLAWTADATTASDTRCVYDPGPGARPSGAAATPAAAAGGARGSGGGEFVAVDVVGATAGAPAAQLDVLAQACAKGSRRPTARTGFTCRFPAGSVFAARVRDGRVVTATASGVPTGTTVAALSTALGQQLDSLG
jgi:hypothetical protein